MVADILDMATEQVTRARGRALVDQQREKPALWERAQEIFARAQGENRAMSTAESARYDELTGLITEINEREQQERTHAERQRQLLEPRRDARMQPGAGDAGQPENSGEYRAVTQRWLRQGMMALTPEERQLMQSGWRSAGPDEQRALGTVGGTSGGYLVPTVLQAEVIETMKAYAPLNDVVSVQETAQGGDIDWPTNDDTANMGAEVAENTDVGAATDPTFGIVTLRAYLYSSKVFKVPFTLLQDSAVDIEAFVGQMAGIRLGRVFANREAVGDGVNKIQGVTVGGVVGKSFAGAAAVTYNELIQLEHSVDPAYRKPGRARYLFADGTLSALRQLADSQARPLWVPWLGSGVAGAVPPTFNGWDYTISNDMPSMATTNKSIAFGDFKTGYKLRLVSGFSLVRLEERYAEFGQVGFLLFARGDGRVVDKAAFKLGQQA